MKVSSKKLMGMFLAIVMALSVAPGVSLQKAGAKERTYDHTSTFLMMPNSPNSSYHTFFTVIGKDDKIKNIRSSNEDIVKTRSIKVTSEEIFGNKQVYFQIKMRKAGTVVISYTVNGKIKYAKITGVEYKNPIKYVSIAGITKKGNKNLADLTKQKPSVSSIKLPKTKKNPQIIVRTGRGYKIKGISCEESIGSEYKTRASKTLKKPADAVKLTVGTMKAQKKYMVTVICVDTKTKAEFYISYIINGK